MAFAASLCLVSLAVVVVRPRREEPGPVVVSSPDLPRLVFEGRHPPGRRVRVLLRYPLRFSDERPLVGVYSPSQGGSVPVTAEFHFRVRPENPASTFVVSGSVSGFRFDGLSRWNRLPGLAVIVDCEAE